MSLSYTTFALVTAGLKGIAKEAISADIGGGVARIAKFCVRGALQGSRFPPVAERPH